MSARREGFSLIEVVVSSGVLLLVVAAFMLIIQAILQALVTEELKATATSVARDGLEMAHNATYEDLGTIGGIPYGLFPQQDVVVIKNKEYLRRFFIVYIDDPFDGTAPTDVVPADYKRVRVEVTWGGLFPSITPVVLWTDIAPIGRESLPNSGTLLINVNNASVQPIQGATVHIVASSISPPIDMTTYSDVNGQVLLPGTPICDSCYSISVTKAGYTTDRTYSRSEVTNPNNPEATVLLGGLASVSLAIDKPASVTFKAVRNSNGTFVPFAGVGMNIKGMKEIGRDAFDSPVYRYSQSIVTAGSGGQVTINGLIWDRYEVSLPTGSSVEFVSSWPFSPLAVLPDTNQTMTIVVQANTLNSLLVRLTDQLNAPLASASVEISRVDIGFIATEAAGLLGSPNASQVFFGGLEAGRFDLRASSSGYLEATASVNVIGDWQETFVMIPE